MLVEPVSDFVFAKIPPKCYQARKCTTELTTHNPHKTDILIKLTVRTCILAALQIVKISIQILCFHIFRFNGPSLHNICMRDINLVD